jgi:hypothetical protein
MVPAPSRSTSMTACQAAKCDTITGTTALAMTATSIECSTTPTSNPSSMVFCQCQVGWAWAQPRLTRCPPGVYPSCMSYWPNMSSRVTVITRGSMDWMLWSTSGLTIQFRARGRETTSECFCPQQVAASDAAGCANEFAFGRNKLRLPTSPDARTCPRSPATSCGFQPID